MRMKAELILFLLTSVILFFCFCVYGEPVEQSKISFSVPYNCETAKGDRTRCLSDGFKPGLNVVLVGKKGLCKTKTADLVTDHYVYAYEATRLSGTESCFTVKHNEKFFNDFDIAVVGADPAVVKLVPLKGGNSPVSKDIEAKARKLAIPRIEEPEDSSDPTAERVTISNAQPKVFRAANITLLIFELLADGSPWEPGPTVALFNGEVFLLEGTCTYGEPTFFSVNDKFYLTYNATRGCCGCGNQWFFVYDFSRGTPKKVYSNGNFAD